MTPRSRGAGRDTPASRHRARHRRHGPARLRCQSPIVEGADRHIRRPSHPVHIVGSILPPEAAPIGDHPAVAAMGRPWAPRSGVGASVVEVGFAVLEAGNLPRPRFRDSPDCCSPVASVAGRRAGQRRWARCRKRGSAQSTTSMDRQRDAHTLNVALPSRHLRPVCSYGPMPSRLARSC